MPELPEVESVRRGLTPILGVVITRVHIARRDVVRDDRAARAGRLDPHALLADDRIASIQRHGKQLALIGGSGRVVLLHLGMSGQLLVSSDEPGPGDHRHVVWSFDGGSFLTFRDPRRFGGVWLLTDRQALNARWSDLGADALSVSGDELAGVLASSQRSVKAALLDQRVLAGVGNIYADESLFHAGITPARPCRSLSRDDWERVGDAVRAVLARALAAGGSTLRDYRRPDGSSGTGVLEHRVYARAGLPCAVCGTPIARVIIAQRSTCWCPACQW